MAANPTVKELEQKTKDLAQLTAAFKRAERVLREAGERHWALAHSLPVGVITVDPELRITDLNPWGETISGYTQSEVVGKFCGDILKGEMCGSSLCPIRNVASSMRPVVRAQTSIRSKCGSRIPIRLSAAGIFDGRGRLIGGVEVFQDISELESFARQRSNLITMFAHDMRSPLVAIQGFARRMLKKGDAISAGKQVTYLQIISKEAEKLERLVTDFLDFARLEAGVLKLDFNAVNLDKELMDLIELYQSRFADVGIMLNAEDCEKLPVIEADVYGLRRVFTNLLDNALKFSDSGTSVTIQAEETEREVMVHVVDQGMGIPSEELPYIFDPFYRGWGQEKRRGFGLGLAGVDAIVKGHGGRMVVTSEVCKGSVFTVILPKMRQGEGNEAQNRL
jgi:two-component system phosphate regulon sensor histidine kinase PhoR